MLLYNLAKVLCLQKRKYVNLKIAKLGVVPIKYKVNNTCGLCKVGSYIANRRLGGQGKKLQ